MLDDRNAEETYRDFAPRAAERRSFAGLAWAVGGLLFFLLHVPLALAMRQSEPLSTMHAFGTLGVAVLLALHRRVELVLFAAAYITGAEVLWRMTDAHVFWEFGKYAVGGLFLLRMATLNGVRWEVRSIVYFLLLVPSIPLTLATYDFGQAREQISFNLSGPFLLMIAVWFLGHLKLTEARVQTAFAVMLAPMLGIAAITLYTTYTTPQLVFNTASNVVTSGGFAPNQVSTILGLGALLAFLLAVMARAGLPYRLLMFSICILLTMQTAMTFSRGGLYAAAAAGVGAAFYLMRDARARIGIVLAGASLLVAIDRVVLPRLDAFTGGMLMTRLRRTTTTGRAEIMAADLEVWMRNPIFGVGPGGAYGVRETDIGPVAAHTEFTRLLAEHGFLGLAAFLLLVWMSVAFFLRQETKQGRALVTAFVVWSVVTMLHSAMRLVAPSLVFGMAAALIYERARSRRWREEEPAPEPELVSAAR